MCENLTENKKIRVVKVEPGRLAQIVEIGTELEDLQEQVQGLIALCYPFSEEDGFEDCVVLNDEGKINGMEPNRALRDGAGRIYDIVFGPFFICDGSGEYLAGLPEDRLKRYAEQFRYPEWFLRSKAGDIRSVPYIPVQEANP